jgi:hypothetical protein
MMFSPRMNSWGFLFQNFDEGDTTPGTTVTPGASNAEGSWTEVAAAASLTSRTYWCEMVVHGGNTSGQAKNHLLDFGIDPAGGTSYTPFFSNLVCGQSATYANGGRIYRFPCDIPAGASVAVRLQGSNGTAGTVLIVVRLFGKPKYPELVRPARYTETLGSITDSTGQSFTPGNAVWGSDQSLGTTTKKHFYAMLGFQIDSTSPSGAYHTQLRIGDGSSFHLIESQMHVINSGNDDIKSIMGAGAPWEIPAGATLYVRGNASQAPTAGCNASAICFGG